MCCSAKYMLVTLADKDIPKDIYDINCRGSVKFDYLTYVCMPSMFAGFILAVG